MTWFRTGTSAKPCAASRRPSNVVSATGATGTGSKGMNSLALVIVLDLIVLDLIVLDLIACVLIAAGLASRIPDFTFAGNALRFVAFAVSLRWLWSPD